MYCAQHVTQAPPLPPPGRGHRVQYMCAQIELGGGEGGGGGYKTMNFYDNN